MWILLAYALLTKLVNIILYMLYCSIFNTKYYLLKTVNKSKNVWGASRGILYIIVFFLLSMKCLSSWQDYMEAFIQMKVKLYLKIILSLYLKIFLNITQSTKQ